MNKNQEANFLINLIKAVINNQEITEIDCNVDLFKVIRYAKFHSLENFCYYGLKNANIDRGIKDKLKKYHHRAILVETVQEAEKQKIISELENNCIKFLPLKGSIIKYLYPSPDLRSMSDLDFLVKKSKLKEIKKIMKSLNYKIYHLGGNHDIYSKPPIMNVEMHHKMMAESYLMSKYFNNIWEKVKLGKESKYQYELSNEDYYLFMVAHAAKHYSVGGTGIRSVLDIWIYLSKYTDILDWDYLMNEFEKLNISLFANNIKKLAYAWFGNEESDKIIDLMADYIIESGTHGNTTHASIKKDFFDQNPLTNIRSTKFKYILRKVFPSFKTLSLQYPILKKMPVLFPLIWIVRLFKIILFRQKAIKVKIKDLKSINQDQIRSIKELHDKTGI